MLSSLAKGVTFTEYPGYGCTAQNDQVLYGRSLTECEDLCKASGECISFEYFPTRELCQTSSTCDFDDAVVGDPVYGDTSLYIKNDIFVLFEDYGCVAQNNYIEHNVALKECRVKCTTDALCISFEWFEDYEGTGPRCQTSYTCDTDGMSPDSGSSYGKIYLYVNKDSISTNVPTPPPTENCLSCNPFAGYELFIRGFNIWKVEVSGSAVLDGDYYDDNIGNDGYTSQVSSCALSSLEFESSFTSYSSYAESVCEFATYLYIYIYIQFCEFATNYLVIIFIIFRIQHRLRQVFKLEQVGQVVLCP